MERFSKKAEKFRKSISPVRQIMNYAESSYLKKIGLEPTDVISFAGGWVNHNSPVELQEAYKEIVDDRELFHKSGGYPPTLGNLDCKEALCDFENHLFNEVISPEEIAIGSSSTQLMYSLFQTILDPGDSILLMDPSYCNIPTQSVVSSKAKILRFPLLDVDNWEYIADEKIDTLYEFIIDEKPKIVLLITPDNPTSQILSDRFVSSVLDAVEKVNGFLIIDFAYKTLLFSDQYPDYFRWKPSDHFLSIHSNSKWGRNLGRRLGWLEASEEIIKSLESIQGSNILCPDNLHQMALTRYLNISIKNGTLRPYITETKKKYEQIAKLTSNAIESLLNMPYLKPQGGLYTCLKTNVDGSEFVEHVLNKGVLLVPGWGFGRTTKNAVRLSFGPLVENEELIIDGLQKVKLCLEQNEYTLQESFQV